MRQRNRKWSAHCPEVKEMKNIIVPIQGTDILPALDADTVTQIQK